MYKDFLRVLGISAFIVFAHFVFIYLVATNINALLPELDWNHSVAVISDRVYLMSSNDTVFPPLTKVFLNFDANFYFDIVTNGYNKGPFTLTEGMKNWAFYPLYPVLVRLLTPACCSNIDTIFVVGLLISNVSLVFSLVILFFVFKRLGLTENSWLLGVLGIILFPTSYILHLFYTESLFLLLTLLAVYFALSKKYFTSAIFVGISGLTRLVGPVGGIFILVLLLFDREKSRAYKLFVIPLLIIISSLGILLFYGYVYRQTGDFLAPIKIQSAWSRLENGTLYPFQTIYVFVSYLLKNGLGIYKSTYFQIIFLIFSLIGIMGLALDKAFSASHRWALFSYSLFYVGLISSSSSEVSIIRFLTVFFPIYLLFPRLFERNKPVFVLVLSIFSLVQGFALVLFLSKVPGYGN